jgi:hypothetical protein
MMLHTALTAAGHSEYDEVRTSYDVNTDEVWVRFTAGTTKIVQFNIPAHLTDPVEYARARWPEWFVARREPEQLDLFKQEKTA